MAAKKQNSNSSSNRTTSKPAAPLAAASSTSVRNSPIPKTQPQGQQQQVGRKMVSQSDIAKRAYEISQSPQNRGQLENWLRAERELKAQ
jgi:hypothetical protein